MIRLALLILLLATPTHAAEMAFFMKNQHSRAVRWPGGDQVYLLEKGERKSVPVICEPGETICYGAWIAGDDSVSWGVGPDNDRRCKDCCSICAGKTTARIDLMP